MNNFNFLPNNVRLFINNKLENKNGLKIISTDTLHRIANAIREKDPDLGDPNMTPIQMPNYIRILDPHGWKFVGGEGGLAFEQGTNLAGLYQNNTLRMYPVISNQVTDMRRAFNNCRNLVGDPMCNNGVVDGHQMYRDCWNLTGEPTPPNKIQSLQNMCQSYYNCGNITGNASVGPSVTDASYAYWNCSNLDGNIQYIDTNSLVNMAYMFHNCSNLHGEPIKSNATTNMAYAYYNCSNLTGNPVVDNTTASMIQMYAECSNLTGRPVASAAATDMSNTYVNCYNLTGPAAFGPLVTNAFWTYRNCHNITDGIMGNNVTGTQCTFRDCHNLGRAFLSPKATYMNATFMNCYNLTGTIRTVPIQTFLGYAFYDCYKLQGVYIVGNSNANAPIMKVANSTNAFNRASAIENNIPLSRLNVVFSQRATMNILAAASVCGCTMTWGGALAAGNNIVSLPLTYANGQIYGYKNYTAVYYWYNEVHNLYLYSVN